MPKVKTQAPYTDVMVDLETLGTTADAVIMSIGAVRFDAEGSRIDDAAFYVSVSIDSNLDYKRVISESTLIWWMGQSEAAKAVFHEPKQSLDAALESLAAWFGDGDQKVWSCGADFDIPMLAHAYASVRMDAPWKFWNARCYRTIKSSAAATRIPKPERSGAHHNALADAVFQAKHLQTINAARNA